MLVKMRNIFIYKYYETLFVFWMNNMMEISIFCVKHTYLYTQIPIQIHAQQGLPPCMEKYPNMVCLMTV